MLADAAGDVKIALCLADDLPYDVSAAAGVVANEPVEHPGYLGRDPEERAIRLAGGVAELLPGGELVEDREPDGDC